MTGVSMAMPSSATAFTSGWIMTHAGKNMAGRQGGRLTAELLKQKQTTAAIRGAV
jgi:hypothetical protein